MKVRGWVVRGWILLLPLLVSGGAWAATPQLNRDFERLCAIYEEMEASDIALAERNQFVQESVAQRVESEEAAAALYAVFELEPARRYRLFREMAELLLEKEWHCAAMESLMKEGP